jgi:hypothetical protein
VNDARAKRLAVAIADELFVNGFNEAAERLVLAVDLPDGQIKNLGGWSWAAVVQRVERHLKGESDV